jgi:uncharacterized protein (TIGR03435 family)
VSEDPLINRSAVRSIAIAVLCVTAVAARQQDGRAPKPVDANRADIVQFDAVSIKPAPLSSDAGGFMPRPGRFSATNVTVKALISFAYGVPARFVLNAPDWVERERVSIVGSSSLRSVNRFPEMLQRALEDRFSLSVSRESKVVPVYALVRDRADGRLGPQLKSSDADCAASKPTGQLPACYLAVTSSSIKARGQEWSRIALQQQLQSAVPESIVDETGLSGRFDVTLDWTNGVDTRSAGNDTVSVFTALREQLGLKLVRTEAPVPVVVINSIERLQPN